MIVSLRAGTAIFDAPMLVDTSYTVVYRNKTNVLKQYLAWMGDNPVQINDNAKKIIDFIDKDIETTQTKE